ncbi:hypothetical protein CJF31_00011429 [Rutstroemia sp. NJR-2017a BVV2]|nr:hypothetical protein CJF31_00011429 [Rutstroemia sp. NJR-2017a BVV2]
MHYTKEISGLGDHEANFTYTKVAELQFLNYINSVTNASDNSIVPFCIPVAESAMLSSSKRPREQSDYSNITEENTDKRGKQQKPATPSSPSQEIANIERSNDIELGSRPSTKEKIVEEKEVY